MERLTKRGATGHAYYPRCFEAPCDGGGCKIRDCLFDNTICERLAAYEDSGCAPEEVLPKDKADEIAMKLMRLADLESLCSYDRLRELAEANKDGRVVVLPCKVGNTVWANLGGMRHTRKCVIEFANIGSHVTTIVFSTADGLREQYGVNLISFGKTVFLTRDEAEKALEVMKEDETKHA